MNPRSSNSTMKGGGPEKSTALPRHQLRLLPHRKAWAVEFHFRRSSALRRTRRSGRSIEHSHPEIGRDSRRAPRPMICTVASPRTSNHFPEGRDEKEIILKRNTATHKRGSVVDAGAARPATTPRRTAYFCGLRFRGLVVANSFNYASYKFVHSTCNLVGPTYLKIVPIH